MRCLLPLLALLVGCTGLVRPSDLRPAPHPLLEGLVVTRRARPRPQATPRAGDEDRGLAAGRRGKILAALERVDGARHIKGRPATDLGLVSAVFGGLGLKSRPEVAPTVERLRGAARLREGRARVGDLVFFHAGRGVPAVGVVMRRLRGGGLELSAVTRGAARTVRAHTGRPTTRRDGRRVINSFLRARRRDDRPNTAYLAGALVMEIRTLLD